MRICEIVEKFPKLSGLSGLVAKDLCIKTEKGLLPINSDECMGSTIKPKEVVYFDLDFSEIWLEVEMTLQDESTKSLKISFEVKVRVESSVGHVRDLLIKMGIKSWAKYILDNEEDPEDYDYYLFTNFIFTNFNGKDMAIENFEEKVKDKFNFESKVKCKLEFLNFNEILYKEIIKLSSGREQKQSTFIFKNEKNRKKVVRKFINEFLEKFCKTDLKSSKLAYHQNVIWKYNEDYNLDKQRFSSFFQTISNNESRRESFLIEDMNSFGYSNNNNHFNLRATDRRIVDVSPLSVNIPFQRNSFDKILHSSFKPFIKFDSRYTQDFLSLQNIDIINLIKVQAENFFSKREFKHLDLPDTKNFKRISRENSVTIEQFNIDTRKNSQEDFPNFMLKNKYYYLKKRMPLIAFILVVLLLMVFITYS